ncbi:MAG: 50S ribosomal protein L19 [Candidatus Brennerbacteria bacterium CG11_big_fil_rev_8_21_14_0_20_43_10]|uniref:50S ribosomal protein L19 n=3 Tax=Candidatus Brenneribacteriota TaxID=1817902 RepID=A0A2M8C3N4_9BACT|nr:MAG: 50S ribosomal protein L19 [Parcubacteria group bacterium CG1_02_44_31]PIP50332.1 MAG: 50S ribosomal protein L19 [Candidatus Brennerbacteria bacterium CG23_combo_of_CG06-09_8_20_14_all_44_41]PIR25418.1 MAG: 50S ribosomal protein L19 [Candidatus Brennerbacteria bacterium CG11_big_fil_rev_8_21_14_0_20_43_10]PIX29351.1 MAG: 50S ribosomal protein L19 [Candidatus Brennerbacteria bacterium CG_4_8_14_3_um_filter_43_14]PJB50705.1 MAG: 50S ribosomal protein L19 [Candidatus Brennerbacteria bacteri
MHTKILAIHKQSLRTDLPDIKAGMKIKVWYKVPEKDKWRTTFFDGIVIATKHGIKNTNASFTMRKIGIDNIGVEMTWLFHSPVIEKIQVLQTPKVRRAKLYYLRSRSRKQVRAKLKTKKAFAELLGKEEKAPESETPKE